MGGGEEGGGPIHIIKACHPHGQGGGGVHSTLLQRCTCQQQGQGTRVQVCHLGCFLRVM